MPDLANIPGFTQLQSITLGTPDIVIAILDGPVDLERACFKGASLTKLAPYWQDEVAIAPQDIQNFLEISNSDDDGETKGKRLKDSIPDEAVISRLNCIFHSTHIISTILGQPGSPVKGIAPKCTGINIPVDITGKGNELISPLNLARAFELALEKGANIIHCAVCIPTQTGIALDILERAVKKCQENNVLVVAPGGNDKGECWCIPAVLPGVLAVGAMKDDGQPFKFSNWGGNYGSNGILAAGENILGAQPTTDVPVRKKGTSCAAPIVTGISALLMSLQLQQGKPVNAEAIRAALLNSAIPCNPQSVEEPERCLRGKLNIPGAYQALTGEQLEITLETLGTNYTNLISLRPSVNNEDEYAPSNSSINPSTVPRGHVYALGTLRYDFSTEAQRDSFKELMPAVNIEGVVVPSNPYDVGQMVNYLKQNPSEGYALIWTLNIGLNPVYAIEAKGAFSEDIYEILQTLLAGGAEPENSDDYIERVSIPARRSDRTVKLLSGQLVPVIEIWDARGICGWKVNTLVSAALQNARVEAENITEDSLRHTIVSFLNRVYYDLQNLGQTSRDRALNFAATNIVQATSIFAKAIVLGMELDSIEMEKSPFCRIDSDCWDVKLKFFDPENCRLAQRIFRFTIDVQDSLPVTLGKVKSWSIPKWEE